MSEFRYSRNDDTGITKIVPYNDKSTKQLIPGYYQLAYNHQFDDYYLTDLQPFEIKSKTYGDLSERTEKVIKAWRSPERIAAMRHSMGVLCIGVKGTGKTLLCRNISIECVKQGIPVIIINEVLHLSFSRWISLVQQPVVIFIDEFSKIFKHDNQVFLLSMMDGITDNNILWLLSGNENDHIHPCMQSRPGRIFYRFDYKSKLPFEIVVAYCKDNIKNKELMKDKELKQMKIIHFLLRLFTYDILIAIVTECNIFDIQPYEALTCMNFDTGFNNQYITVKSVQKSDGCPVTNWTVEKGEFYTIDKIIVNIDSKNIHLNMDDIDNVDYDTGDITYKKDEYIFATRIMTTEDHSVVWQRQILYKDLGEVHKF